jgi:hypothetical protein
MRAAMHGQRRIRAERRRLRVGDFVSEVGGKEIGIVTYIMEKDADLVVVSWPPDRQGYCYHRDDLVKL